MPLLPRAQRYLRSLRQIERAALAEKVGISLPHLQNIIYGKKAPGVELACRLEIECRSAITRRDLRPDLDWDLIQGTSADLVTAGASRRSAHS